MKSDIEKEIEEDMLEAFHRANLTLWASGIISRSQYKENAIKIRLRACVVRSEQ